MKEIEEVKAIFIIDGIVRSDKYPGNVEVLLVPKEKIQTGNGNIEPDMPPMIMSGGAEGMPTGLMMALKSLPNAIEQMGRGTHKEKKRDIIWVEDEISFNQRNWKTGDEIEVNLTLIKKV